MLAGDRDGLFVESAQAGHVRVAIHDPERDENYGLLVEEGHLGFLAVDLLAAAVEAYRRSGKPLSNSTEVELEYPTIQPTTLALGSSHLPDHDSITLRFGEAALGLAIPRRMLIELGRALRALEAGGTAH